MKPETLLAWDDLRYFLAIAAAGSLSRAARVLGVDHATLSRRLAAFERSLGLRLFHRSRGGVELTRSGQEVAHLARVVEEDMLAVERKLAALDDRSGLVRLATSGILSVGLVAPHVAALLRAHPSVQIEVQVSRGLVSLARREADVALRLRPPGSHVAEPSAVVSVLARIGWAAYAGTRTGTLGAPIRYTGPTRPGTAWLDREAAASPGVLVDEVPTALELVRHGAGVAVLPCFLADGARGLYRRSAVLDQHRLVLAVPGELRRVARVRAVMDWLKELTTRDRARLLG